MRELAALENPQMREVNERRGDDHGVNLSQLRALAKRLKTQHDLARELWATDDTAAQLLAILICRPKAFERDELDAMLREARAPKVHDWLVNYVVKKSPHAEELRVAWFEDPDPVVASAGWALTTERVAKGRQRPRSRRTARPHRSRDEGRSRSPAVGHEPLPRADRHHACRAPRPCHRHRRTTRGAEGLPDAAELHLAVRAHLDRRDGSPPRRCVIAARPGPRGRTERSSSSAPVRRSDVELHPDRMKRTSPCLGSVTAFTDDGEGLS